MQAAKNKKLTYFLIFAVAVVWGVVLHRIFFNGEADDDVLKNPSAVDQHQPYDEYMPKPDTFKLALNYKDPFLGDLAPLAAPLPEVTAIKPVNFVPPAPLKPIIDWTAIRYSGYIINPVTKKTVCIIAVNGTERMLAEGEQFEGARLLKNKKDSVLISWKGKQKYIKQ